MRKICVVTGTRAEYGLLSRLMAMIRDSSNTELQLVVTNMHLSPRFGNTYLEIEHDGFQISEKLPVLDEEAEDGPVETVRAMSRVQSGLAEIFSRVKPDLLLLLGDRYEIFAAASAALVLGIPVAHIGGGNITEGAFDEAFRHSITKMSHLHFVSTEQARRRVLQLGEDSARVFNVGSIGLDDIRQTNLMTKQELEKSIGLSIDENTLLITYHPVTLSRDESSMALDALLGALDERTGLRMVFTYPNADCGGRGIASRLEDYVRENSCRARVFRSLGYVRYLSCMRYCGAVVGNSSSGIVEAPSFQLPTLDIGSRQKGRIAADSVVHCSADIGSIREGLQKVLSPEFRAQAARTVNPYEKPDTVRAIFNVISGHPLDGITRKSFCEM